MPTDPITIQRAYYSATAATYDGMHVAEDDEHGFALAYMLAVVDHFGVESILDIGSGTGRALLRMKQKMPHVRVVGVEPSAELRDMGYTKGLSASDLIDGDAILTKSHSGLMFSICYRISSGGTSIGPRSKFNRAI
jgi:ubiquinone/menaquinone biosynthesis C-methylase UbiE